MDEQPLHDWPYGSDEMAGRIRRHDWSRTPLGPIEEWSGRLKLMVELVLVNPLVSSLVCGPERLLIYNDAAARLYGDRHPAALGRSLPEAFPEGWSTVAPLYERAFAGEVVEVLSQPLDTRGESEATDVFDATLTPVRDESGQVAFVHMTGQEIGSRVRAEEAMRESEARRASDLSGLRSLYELNARLANEPNLLVRMEEIAAAANGFLNTDRGCVQLVSADGERLEMFAYRGYEPSSPFIQHFLREGSKPACDAARQYGHRLVIENVATFPGLQGTADREVGLREDILATQSTPMITRSGEMVGVLSNQFRQPHRPTDDQLRLVDMLAWSGAEIIERHRAETALRESEELRRIALAGGGMGTWRWDLGRRLVWGDERFLAFWGFPPSDDPLPLSLFTERQSPEGIAQTEGIVTKAIEGGEEFDAPIEVVSGPTAGRWLRWRGRASTNDPSVLFGVSFDITQQRHVELRLRDSEVRQTFLLKLSDALRPVGNPVDIQRMATRLLGEHLNASRVFYVVVDRDGDTADVLGDYTAGVPSRVGRYSLSAFSTYAVGEWRAGRIASSDDVTVDPRYGAAEREAYASVSTRAGFGIPLIKDGRLVALLGVNQSSPRHWTDHDTDLASEVAERTWAAIERARAEAALRESEAKYRTLFETMTDGYAIGELRRDAFGQAIDWRFVEFNPALTRHTGMDPAASAGRWFSELFPGADQTYWLGVYQSVVDTQTVRPFEDYWPPLDRWLAGEAYPAENGRFTIMYRDVTGRKRSELALRESGERQAFLLRLSDTLRPLGAAEDVKKTAARLLGEHLGVNRAFYGEVEGDDWVIPGDFEQGIVPLTPGRYAAATYGGWMMDTYRRGEVLNFSDSRTDPRFGASEREALAKFQITAALGVGLMKEGRLAAIFAVHSATPRVWSEAETALVDNVAERIWAAVEHARAESALRASEAERRTLIAEMNEGFCILEVILDESGHGTDYRFIETNPAFVRQGGFDPAGRLMSEIAPIEPIWPAAYGRVARTGVPERIVDAAAAFGRTYDVYAFRIGAAANRRIAVFFTDITARVEAEAKLRESEERFRALVTAGTYSIYRMSPDWRLMYQLDSQTLANTSAPIENWVDKYILAEDRRQVFAAIDAAIQTRSLFELEHRVLLADGSIGWVLSRAVPLFSPDGEVAEWFGAGSDITERKAAELQLREREADLARVQRIGAVGGLDIDVANGLRSRRSPEYLRLHGLPSTSFEETHAQWRERVHPEDRKQAERALFEALDGNGASYEGEYRIVRPSDGAVRWIYARADIDRDGDGKPLRLVGAHLDVTEQKRTQEALRVSEERLRGFGEASTDVLWIRDADTLAWTYLTPAFETIYGLPREEALGGDDFRTWTDLIVEDDRDRALAAIDQARHGERVAFEYRIRRPSDGAIRWLRNTDFPIRNAEGRITAIGGVGHDISQEKEAERLVRASRRQLRTLVEGLPQLVWRGVDGGEWTWSSPQWTAFTGLSEIASTGRGWLAALHPDDREEAMEAWRQAEATGEPLEVEYRIRQAGGETYRWFQTRALPVRDEDTGEIVEWLGTSNDIDDLRQLQDELSVMVAELQHRTRNLIGVVGSIARQTMAQTGPTDAFQREFTDRLEALSRVQGLLSQAGEERVTIGQVVEMELKALGAMSFGDRVMVAGPDVPLRKSIVQTMAMAIHELATNARKYGALSNEAGELTVRWSTSRAENEERRLFFEWTERGVDVRFENGKAVTQGGGYGRQLIEKSLPYSLKARTTYGLEADGLRCTIDLPLAKLGSRSRS